MNIYWIDNADKRVLFEAVLGEESKIPTIGSFEDFSMDGEEPDPYIIVNIERHDGGHVDVIMEKVVTFKSN